MEYTLVKFDNKAKVARLLLGAEKLLAILNQKEKDNPTGKYLFRVIFIVHHIIYFQSSRY